MISKDDASALFDRLRDALIDVERAIIEIIKAKAWEPLGYATFAEAWADRLSDVRLGNRSDMLRAHVVYQMISEGLSDEQIIETTLISDTKVADLRLAKSAGIKPDLVTREALSYVHGHMRAKPGARVLLHVNLGADELERCKAIAKKAGLRIEEEARWAIRRHFDALEKDLAQGQ